jgi:Zn-dependent protease
VDVSQLLLVAPVLLFSLVAHEYAHGYAALRQGDATAYQLGRLTWNPVKHIDPFMTVLVPVMLALAGGPIFGGAKPVPIEPRNFRNYRRGDIIVSLAGVATNLALAPVCALAFVVLGLVGQQLPSLAPSLIILQSMARYGVVVNLVLAVFNLLPLPPLDGSRVFKYLLPPAWAIQYQNLGRFGFLLLFAFLYLGGGLLRGWIAPAYLVDASIMRAVAPFVIRAPSA